MRKSLSKISAFILTLLLVVGVSACKREAYKYEISFETNGGNSLSSIEIEWGDIIVLPTPTRTGYSFDGWFLDNVLTNPFVEGTEASEDVTYYAKWNINQYSVIFNAEPGTFGDASTITKTDNFGSTVSVDKPVLSGYHFVGWYTDSALKTVFNSKISSKDITVYAKYDLDKLNVYFDPNGGTGNMSSMSLTVKSTDTKLNQNAFTKDGYNFVCWNTKADGTGKDYADLADLKDEIVNGSLTLYAKWEKVKYSLRFVNDSTTIKEFNLSYGDDIPFDEVTNPTKEGKTFVGFGTFQKSTDTSFNKAKNYYSYNGTSYALKTTFVDTDKPSDFYEIVVDKDFTKMVGHNHVLYACFKNNGILITFDSNGGSSIDNIESFTGSQVSAPETPTKDGYRFAGWCLEEENDNGKGDVYQFSTCPNTNTTLYAKWDENKYTIKFNSNTGNGTIADLLNNLYSSNVSLTANTFTKVGYTFKEWNTKADGSGTSYEDNATVSKLVKENNGSITLYAIWDANTVEYKVIHKVQNLDLSFTEKESETLSGKSGEATQAIIKDYFGFTASEFDQVAINGDGSTEIVIEYTRNKYDVVFKDGEEVLEGKTQEGKLFGSIVTFPTLSRTGYKYTVTCEGETVSGSIEIKEEFINNNKVTIVVKYKELETSGVFFENVPQEYDDIEEQEGTEVEIPADPSKTGYIFLGWSLTEGGEISTVYVSGYTFNLEAEALTLYANFEAISYTVKFESNDDRDVTLISTINATYDVSFDVPSVTRVGYTFKEWNTLDDGTGTSYTSSTMVNLTSTDESEVTLYAIWTINKYKVTFVVDEVNYQVIEKDFGYKYASDLNDDPSKTGFNFLGWYKGESKYVIDADTAIGREDITLVAKFERVTLHYVFNYKDANKVDKEEDNELKYEDEVTLPTDFVTLITGDDKCLVFVGWSKTEGGSIVNVDLTAGVEDVTYYAVYKELPVIVIYTDDLNGNVIYKDIDSIIDVNETYIRELAYKFIVETIYELSQDPTNPSNKVVALMNYYGTLMQTKNVSTLDAISAAIAAAKASYDGVEIDYLYTITDKNELTYLVTLAMAGDAVFKATSGSQEQLDAFAAMESAITAVLTNISFDATYLEKYGTLYAEKHNASLYAYIENAYNKAQAYKFIVDSIDEFISSGQATNSTFLTNVMPYFVVQFIGNPNEGVDQGVKYNGYQLVYQLGVNPYLLYIDNETFIQLVLTFAGSQNQGDLENVLTVARFEYEYNQAIVDQFTLGGYNPYKDELSAFDGFGVDIVEGDDAIYKYFYAKWAKALDKVTGLTLTPTSESSATVKFNSVEGAKGYLVTVKVNGVVLDGFNNKYIETTSFELTSLSSDDKVIINVVAVTKEVSSAESDLSSEYITVKYNSFADGSELTQPQIILSSKNTELKVDFIYSSSVEVEKASDYVYYGVTDQGKGVYYFYPNHTYNFTSHTSITIVDGASLVQVNGGSLSTLSTLGQFVFYFDDDSEHELVGVVLAYPDSITLGQSLQNYENVKAHSLTSNKDFLNSTMDLYQIGVIDNINKPNYLLNSIVDGTHFYNGFKFDIAIIGKVGSDDVKLSSTEFPLEYTFYYFNGSSYIKMSQAQVGEFVVYDNINDIFYFKKGTVEGSQKFKVVITYKQDIEGTYTNVNVPNIYKSDDSRNEALTCSFEFQVNDGLNVYDRVQLRNAFGDRKAKGINLHANIEAEFDPAGVFYVGNGVELKNADGGDANIIDYTAVVSTSAKYKLYNKDNSATDYAFIDVNGDKYVYNEHGTVGLIDARFEYAEFNGKYKVNETSGYGATYQMASCFQRAYTGDTIFDVEDLRINGNYFTVDASKLAYMRAEGNVADQIGGGEEGYSIQNIHSCVFYIDAEAETLFKNLSIIGNNMDYSEFKNDSRFYGYKENKYMTITSGSINGIMIMAKQTGVKLDENNKYAANSNNYLDYHQSLDENNHNFLPESTARLENVNITGTLIALFSDGFTNIKADYTNINDSWANSIYGYNAQKIELTNSKIGVSGGAAIHVEDHVAIDNAVEPLNPQIVLDGNTLDNIHNELTGGEQWFVAYGMSTLAIGMKVQLNAQLNPAGFTVTQGEKLNLIFLTKLEGYKTEPGDIELDEKVDITITDYTDLGNGIKGVLAGDYPNFYPNPDNSIALEFEQDAVGIHLGVMVELYPYQPK